MNHTSSVDPFKQNEEDNIDLKKIMYLFRRQWKWVVLFSILGVIGGLVYIKSTKPSYIVNTSILIPESSSNLEMENIFKGAINMPRNNIHNQIEILKSYYTINKTLLNLNWRTNWYKKDLLVWKDIYSKDPYIITEPSDFMNPRGLKIHITPISEKNYIINVNGESVDNNRKIKVKFEDVGEFGRPYINDQFNFTLQKIKDESEKIGNKYYFVFNDLNNATLEYQSKLSAIIKDKKSDIIECSIIGEVPKKESEFLNELISVYSEGKMDFQNEAKRRSLDFINTQLSGISDSMNSAGTKFTEFRAKNNIIDLGEEGNIVMNNLKDIETESARSRMQLEYFQNLLKYLNDSRDLKQLVSPSVVGIEDVALNALVLKLGELYNRRQILSFSAKENNPTLIMIDRELNQTRNQLVENLRNLIDNASRNVNSQKERQDRISVQLNRLPQKEQQMVNIQRQFNLTSEIYTFLLQKRAETNIALASTLPDVQIIDISRPQTARPMGLSNKMVLIMGFILGLSLPLGYILLINFFDDRIRTQKDLEKKTAIPVLGNIMHNNLKSDLVVYENPKSTIAESFRVLRTNLQYMVSGLQSKIISIHSNNPGEGKSFSAINLACILAMNNKKVLLIGADMRKPRLHKTFNIPNDKGLSTYLIGLHTIDQVIFPTLVENLSLLPSGPIPPNPAEIIGKPEMASLLDTARTNFDYIVIDNAPTALVTDAHVLSHLTDLNIFILRYGVSHMSQLEVINQYANQKIMSNMAILVNDIKTNSFGYSYYKYYQYESYQKTYYSAEDQGEKIHHKKKELKLNGERVNV